MIKVAFHLEEPLSEIIKKDPKQFSGLMDRLNSNRTLYSDANRTLYCPMYASSAKIDLGQEPATGSNRHNAYTESTPYQTPAPSPFTSPACSMSTDYEEQETLEEQQQRESRETSWRQSRSETSFGQFQIDPKTGRPVIGLKPCCSPIDPDFNVNTYPYSLLMPKKLTRRRSIETFKHQDWLDFFKIDMKSSSSCTSS